MRFIDPSFKILYCPDGEEALALLEYIGRQAYKSEDQIHGVWEECKECNGNGSVPDPDAAGWFYTCPTCNGSKGVKYDEPSSHKFIRMILRTDRRARLSKQVQALLDAQAAQLRTAASDTELSKSIVDLVLNDVRDNPAHESVIEHCHMTVEFHVNRGVTHEIVRHRIAAYTQESTRYCNYSKGKFGSAVAYTPMRTAEQLGSDLGRYLELLQLINDEYIELARNGVKPEIARGMLGQDTAALIVMTANFREWKHFFKLRTSLRAHPDMREVTIPLLAEVRKRIPIIFDEL